ncbi:RAB6A-GEF complex partner protein 2 [Geosmithia morbida]|uniref:RAB6A-GEF complex partner protein 2 n=1 Tax=Geosmithia morbida TaxID=1094350 RepID=A0A9P4YX36_9HYPO|nr:RAB6A-GEF complex partner protein 2 [Geosmithia morbida]KAF4123655.1 RAB6A-GEF complex partner protein 2 [Geosmithia morbida]
MAPSEDPSNLRVFVHWHDQTIFAGEEVKCTITFKNVASDSDRSQKPPPSFDRLRNGLGSPNPSAALDLSRKSSRSSPRPMPEFRFPAASPTSSEAAPPANPSKTPDQGLLSPTGAADQNGGGLPTRNSRTQGSPKAEKPQPAARILASNTMTEATPRSSGEFYAVSNHSSETLASEYISHPHSSKPLSHLRRQSSLAPQKPHSPEMLMMGYVQIQGSFTLDGSLVDLTPFELVKKKAVVGGRGGGVVGLEPSRQRESGLFRGLGWSNISNSLGDLLGGNELSTIREMRGVANSKAVPLLSTSQSILFVDLRLAPGESRSFEYTTRLPRGLPPSHKGKAMKISYSLVIGTQKAGGPKEQQVRSVEAPFRVLGGVNSSGEILGHDLMQPYILLRDEAKIKTLGGVNGGSGGSNSLGVPRPPFTHKSKALSRAPATMNDFLTYVDELVTGPRDENSGQLLSPSGPGSLSRRGSGFGPEDGVGGTTSSSDAIHFAIMRSNMTGEGQQSPNRFEISRNGQRVGVVMLTRPSYRLGETITMAIDLTGADMACYAVHTTLETCERVDPSLAVRSESSIQRVTRKVYVTSSDTTLYSRRVVFTPTIPISATPEFVTSGISLEWKIRVEFVIAALTPQQQQQQQQQQQRRRRRQQQRQRGEEEEEEEEDDDDDDDDYINGVDGGRGQPASHPLLEQISQDERGGLVLAAAENLACESFDVMVPLRVYGAVGSGLERLERDEASEEGLVV